MSRGRKKRTPRPARCPTLVAMHLAPEVGITERNAIVAIERGWADTHRFNVLSTCRDLLIIAADRKRDKQALDVCELAAVALLNIKDRYLERKRIGATGDELQALHVLVDFSEDFWKRQSGELFIFANHELDKARAEQARAAA